MTQAAMSPEEIRRIAEAIAQKLNGQVPSPSPSTSTSTPNATANPTPNARVPEGVNLGDGVFDNLDAAIRAARTAFVALSGIGLERRYVVIEAMRNAARPAAEPLARLAVEETGLGRITDKVEKNLLVTNKTPGPEDLVPTAQSGDRGLT